MHSNNEDLINCIKLFCAGTFLGKILYDLLYSKNEYPEIFKKLEKLNIKL